MKAAIFFERDGVLNLCESKHGVQVVPNRLEQFRVNPDASALLQELKKAGFILIATTNQPGVTHGEVTRSEIDLMHTILRRKLPLDDVMLCASDDPTHPCMKPNPGMFIEAAFKWSLDLDHCYVISDKWQDAKAAQVAGCTSIMIRSPWIGDDHHDFVVGSLTEAVAKIHQLHASPMTYAAAGA
jgi:D-glycero-D-manno-heptose 1,7-bisphosphate phosphatase